MGRVPWKSQVRALKSGVQCLTLHWKPWLTCIFHHYVCAGQWDLEWKRILNTKSRLQLPQKELTKWSKGSKINYTEIIKIMIMMKAFCIFFKKSNNVKKINILFSHKLNTKKIPAIFFFLSNYMPPLPKFSLIISVLDKFLDMVMRVFTQFQVSNC